MNDVIWKVWKVVREMMDVDFDLIMYVKCEEFWLFGFVNSLYFHPQQRKMQPKQKKTPPCTYIHALLPPLYLPTPHPSYNYHHTAAENNSDALFHLSLTHQLNHAPCHAHTNTDCAQPFYFHIPLYILHSHYNNQIKIIPNSSS